MLAPGFFHDRINNIIIQLYISFENSQKITMPLSESRYMPHLKNCFMPVLITLLALSCLSVLGGCASKKNPVESPADILLLEKWSNDYPLSELSRLPAGQQDTGAGYIGDVETFLPVWRAFMPMEILPAVDFSRNIVVFTRNTQFYNHTAILRVTLLEGVAEVIAMETMSANPIKDKVAMAMAVIPREGLREIKVGSERIRIMPRQ